ncbi:MAG: TonB-dependent receptor [Pseudomonadota bacterium]
MTVRHVLTPFVIGGLAALTAPPVMSQSNSAQNDNLEEIVVTARRREESVLDAPVAVNVFSGRDVIDAGIERVEDFIQFTPNVTLATSQGIGTSFLTIRGLTQVRNGEAPVATLVDGVLQFSGIQFRQEIFDIQSIEVVKGPQGAIYGRNATGGAIIINTQRPSNETDGYVNLGYGDGNEFRVGGAISGALVEDELYGRLSVNYIDRDGYLDNLTRGTEDDAFEDLAVRARVIWEPTDNLSVDLRANFARHDGRGIGFQFQGVNLAADGITATGFGVDTGPVDADNVLPIISNNPDIGARDTDDFAAKIDWETGSGTFTSTTSFTTIEEFADSDQFPYTNARSAPELFGFDGTQTGYFDLEAWSQEFRFASPADQRLRWEVGAYYLDWERFVSLSTGVDTGNGILRVEREPLTDPANPTTSLLADDNENTATAFFGSLAYDITDQLEFSLALRYDDEERVQFVSPLQFPAGQPGARNEESFDKLQPKVTLRYQPTPNQNWYATYGEGFRSGQFNQNGIAQVAAGAGIIGVSDVADQEDSESFEVGFKGNFLDDRLRLGAALFTTDVEGQQFFSFIGAISAQILTNIDDVSLWGGELELVYRATDQLDAYAAIGYTNSEIEAYAVDPTAVGNEAPYIADNTFNAGIRYELANSLFEATPYVRLDYERRGSQFWDVNNSTARSALDFLNVRLGLQHQNWLLSADIENALDEEYNSEWVAGGFSAAAPGRIWRVQLRYDFF